MIQSPTYYIDVSPRLTLDGSLLPLDALSIFSIVSKFMGEYPHDWDGHLKSISDRGYNCIHFTPLQQRGQSNSPYSLFDQQTFDPMTFSNGEKDISDLIKRMETEYDLLGLIDVVWNHTANNSKWLESHPEVGYSIETAPWLESALELDTALLEFSDKLESHHIPSNLTSQSDLETLIEALRTHVIEPLQLWQYYVVDVKNNTQEIVQAWSAGIPNHDSRGSIYDELNLKDIKGWSLAEKADFILKNCFVGADKLGSRYERQVKIDQGAAFLYYLHGASQHNNNDTHAVTQTMMEIIDRINVAFYDEFNDDVTIIQQQLRDRIRYLRLDNDGPKWGPISKTSALIESYFTRLPLSSTTKHHDTKALSLVNNGWIWAADALKDHAGSDSKAYLRREVIVWGDCVKLRYGRSPDDSPFLWRYMTDYTRLMAKYFAAFRIDNCHSTPIYVAEYLLDQARQVRPNLAVFAELFTGSEETDYLFVKRLGISALIREAMQAWSTQEVSRLVHMHGGRPIGSFEVDEVFHAPVETQIGNSSTTVNGVSANVVERVHRIRQSPVHALFADCTHDNEFPAQKRDARDTLSTGALVEMCACATGSVMGYDEIYPRRLNIVSENRTYAQSGLNTGIAKAKCLLNTLHTRMALEGYEETFIHHEDEFITIHRVQPQSRKGYFLAAHTAFPGYSDGHGSLTPVFLSGTKAKLICCEKLEVDASPETVEKTAEHPSLTVGLPSQLTELEGTLVNSKTGDTTLTMPSKFPPGSIALFETWTPGAEHSEGLDHFVTSGATQTFAHLDLIDLNFLLYRCDSEERDSSAGADGVYSIPGYGALVYAGLQGWWSVLKIVVRNNDLGHPICNHLRDGQWALDYIVSRLHRITKRERRPALEDIARWFFHRFDTIKKVPSFLLPRYFALVIQAAYNAAWARGLSLFSENIRYGQKFLQALAMTSIQLTGTTKSASLVPFQGKPCLSAGLPHFTTDWTRCWGRDIFIALRGIFLCTGRYQDAKEHILAFASVLKHGMIPNLLSDGKLPRYNSRDSIWFFLQSIQDYTKIVPNGVNLLQEKVKRRFLPYDDTFFEFDDPRAYSTESNIAEIIQEAFQRHASGLSFREANAGPKLDKQMRTEGFQLDVHVDWKTGLVFGGNQFNCGTWMDKMGESEKAGSKGIPGTPRDGAAVEITGLLYSTLRWVAELHEKGFYKWSCVKTPENGEVSFGSWAGLIQTNFEKCYFVPTDPSKDTWYNVNPQIINRRGIYKDLYLSGKEYEDYQLRPNFPIAMTVAPELFDPKHALGALEITDKVLRGPTGMATLDPSDLNYRPYYNNSEDSTDFATSKGRNYHQGTEWLWPTGFFLRALLKFDLKRRTTAEGRTEAFQQITRRLHSCKRTVESSPWAGLPELTNKGGEVCSDSVSSHRKTVDI